ncbi:hypothetical protein WKH24_10990 [Pantoea agglomerans]|uniref:hypothetical protein n=1 Tax=Enterobacter agglomerans TaxID=549 RepID=UPI003C7E1412
MNFDEITFINELFKKSIEQTITWSLSGAIPAILYRQSDILIISCYESNFLSHNKKLYLYRFRASEYDGEHDANYNVEKIEVALIHYDQVPWHSHSDSSPIHNLYNYVSSMYSGINELFK